MREVADLSLIFTKYSITAMLVIIFAYIIHSQDACEWVTHDFEVLLLKEKQILQLKVGCSR